MTTQRGKTTSNSLNIFIKWLFIYALLLLILGLIVYASYKFYTLSFWQDFLSNTLATLAGAIIGIPIGFWISKYQETQVEDQRKKKILQLLYSELNSNKDLLTKWIYPEGKDDELWVNPDDKVSTDMLSIFLRNEAWRAFADGGELEWIKDPVLLEKLALAYHRIEIIKQLSIRYYDITTHRGPGVRPKDIQGLSSEIDEGIITINDFLNSVVNEIRTIL